MKIPFGEAKIRTLVVSTLKYSNLFSQLFLGATSSTISSRCCYSVWMRHLLFLSRFNNCSIPRRIAELGPGDSLGVGLAALLSGVESYYALDVVKHWNNERNAQIFDELLELFKSKTRIPDNAEFPNVRPILDDHDFPSNILTNEVLKVALDVERITKIRDEILMPECKDNLYIRCEVPWINKDVIQPDSVDFIISQAVLQSVQDIDGAYSAMRAWLKPGGFMSHTIDYRSLGFSKSWNGHWTYSDCEWKIIQGGRKYTINREPHSTHLRLHNKNYFKILHIIANAQSNLLKVKDLAKRFKHLSDADLNTSGSYILSQKDK